MATEISSGTNPYKLGSPPDFGTLYSGRALEFDGVTDYVSLGTPASLSLASIDFSIGAWVQRGGTGQEFIFRQGSVAATSKRIHIGFTSGDEVKFAFYGDDAATTTTITDTSWHYFVFTYVTSTKLQSIYIDGLLDTTRTASNHFSGDAETLIGAYATTGDGNEFDGKITNIQIWDKAWSESDVQYAYTHPEKLITDNSAVTSGTTISNLKAWYPCTEGNPRSPQTTVYDGSPKGALSGELVANGTFDSDISGWEAEAGGSTVAWSSGQMNIVRSGSGSAGVQTAGYDITGLTVGYIYRLTAHVTARSHGVSIAFSGGVTTLEGGATISATGVVWRHVVANSTTHTLYIGARDSASATATIDNVSVKQIGVSNHGTTTFYGDELVTNGDMEADSNWADYNSVSSNTRSATQEHAGTYSRKFTPDNTSQGIQGDTFTTVTGRTYAVDFWVYPDDGTIVRWVVRKGDNSAFQSDTAVTGLTENAWNNVTGTYVEAAGGSGAYLVVHSNTQTSGDFYIDDVSIKEVGVAAGWTTADAEPLIPQTALMGMSKPMVFDGIDNRVSTSSSSDFPVGDLSRTISAWICPTTYSTFSNIIGYGADTTSDLFAMCFSSGGNLGLWGSGDNYDSGLSISLNKWHHVVLTYDGTNIIGYVDGSKGATTAKSYNTTQSGFWIGYSAIYYDAFQGMINEVSVWNDDFTLAEVQELFNDGVPLDATTHSQSSNLTGYWRNDGASTWTDRSANSNDGTVTGSPDTILLPEGTTSGKDILGFPLTHTNNGWLNLSGSEYVDAGDSTVLDIQSAITIEAWIKCDDITAQKCPVGRDDLTNRNFFLLAWDDAKFYFYFYVSGSAKAVASTTSYTANTWFYVVGTYDGANQKLYINGALEDNDAETGNIDNDDVSLTIGALEDGGGRHFKGSLDEIRVYNRALSAAEITKNYNHGKGKHS